MENARSLGNRQKKMSVRQFSRCPYRKLKGLTATANRLILAADERSLQIDLVRLDRTVQVAGCVGSRDPGPSTPTQRAARKSPKQLAFGNIDRLVFAGLYRLAPGTLDALKILKPQTVIRWHRAGLRAYWRWNHDLAVGGQR